MKSISEPSFEEYTKFHSMLCEPGTSQRCIDSFTGCAVFASQREYETVGNLETVDYNCTPIRLSLFTYYWLVLVSFTGLSTLLGATHVMLVRDESITFSANNIADKASDPEHNILFTSKSHPNLSLPPKIIGYIRERSRVLTGGLPDTVTLTRRFEIDFSGFLSVMMCHFVCSHGRKHLIEVYQVRSGILSIVASGIVSSTKAFLWLLGQFFGSTKTTKDD